MYRRLTVLLIALVSVFFSGINITSENFNEERFIEVEIKGEVENPGIYQLKLGSSIKDLFDRAILKDGAEVSQYSFNTVLYNSQVIVVGKQKNKLVSINAAQLEELMTLPGIGEALAERIIDYRRIYGSFNNLEELKNVNGIGENKYNKIKEYICL